MKDYSFKTEGMFWVDDGTKEYLFYGTLHVKKGGQLLLELIWPSGQDTNLQINNIQNCGIKGVLRKWGTPREHYFFAPNAELFFPEIHHFGWFSGIKFRIEQAIFEQIFAGLPQKKDSILHSDLKYLKSEVNYGKLLDYGQIDIIKPSKRFGTDLLLELKKTSIIEERALTDISSAGGRLIDNRLHLKLQDQNTEIAFEYSDWIGARANDCHGLQVLIQFSHTASYEEHVEFERRLHVSLMFLFGIPINRQFHIFIREPRIEDMPHHPKLHTWYPSFEIDGLTQRDFITKSPFTYLRSDLDECGQFESLVGNWMKAVESHPGISKYVLETLYEKHTKKAPLFDRISNLFKRTEGLFKLFYSTQDIINFLNKFTLAPCSTALQAFEAPRSFFDKIEEKKTAIIKLHAKKKGTDEKVTAAIIYTIILSNFSSRGLFDGIMVEDVADTLSKLRNGMMHKGKLVAQNSGFAHQALYDFCLKIFEIFVLTEIMRLDTEHLKQDAPENGFMNIGPCDGAMRDDFRKDFITLASLL